MGSLLTHWQRHTPGNPIRCECGQPMNSRGRREKRFWTTLGRVPFGRSFYQYTGCHAGRFPDDERLDIVHPGYSPGLRRLMIRAGSQTQFAQAAQDLRCDASLDLEPREIDRVTAQLL